MLRSRIASALILIPFILGSVYFGGLVFFAMGAVFLLVAGWEFYQMVEHAGHAPLTWLGMTLIAALLVNAQFNLGLAREIVVAAVVLSMVAAVFRRGEHWLVGWALTFAGALYIGGLGQYFLEVRQLSNGAYWTILALVSVWATDTGAYLVGTRIGKHGFFTSVSPKKTWEGAIGGWVSAPLTALALGLVLQAVPGTSFHIDIVNSLVFGFGLGVAGTFGDLAESLLKRQVGVKDSGNILPGHGGLLDRIDSLVFAAVFTYYYLIWILHVS